MAPIVDGPTHRDGPLAFVDAIEAPELDDEDRHHFARVVRVRPGEAMVVCDGRGGWRRAVFGTEIEPTGDIVRVAAPTPALAVGFALIKGDRPELVVQKLTELGIDRIVPFAAEHSVVRWEPAKAEKSQRRLQRIAREASMQCRRTWLPDVGELTSFDALVAAEPAVVLADAGGTVTLRDLVGDAARAESTAGVTPMVLVGPEGGWSSAERDAGLPTVTVAAHILRAETASMAVATLLAAVRGGYV